MVSGATLVQDLEFGHLQVKVADGTSISAGTLLKYGDANLAVANAADDLAQDFAGIAISDKLENDGSDTLAVAKKHSVYEILCSSVVTAGNVVEMSGANTVHTKTDDTIDTHATIVGIALQTAAAGETIEIQLGA